MVTALRFPFAASSGVLVTLAVFSVLWSFVSVPLDVGRPLPSTVVEWTRQIQQTPTESTRTEKPVRKPPPPVPEPPRGQIGGKTVESTPFKKVVFEPLRPQRRIDAPMRPDGDVIPVVRPAPDYPPRPLAAGVEGWVQVRFTVTTIGTVKDAIVVDAEPNKVFDDAALKSIARWRYNPRVENGTAVERVGLQAIIRFQIDK